MLGDALYEPDKPHHSSNRVVGIYHAHTHSKYKERVLSSFKSLSGTIRVVVATTALGMGVNFPDVKYIVHAGLERSLVDYIQAAGRAGRNGTMATSWHSVQQTLKNLFGLMGVFVRHCSEILVQMFIQFNPFMTVVQIVLHTAAANRKNVKSPFHS